MKTSNSITTNYNNPEIEAQILDLDTELTDYAKLQAKEDALREGELTETLFNIKVKEYFCSRVQMSIDAIRNTLLVTAVVVDANEVDLRNQKKVAEISNEVNDRLHRRAILKRQRDGIILDPLKKKYGKWLILVALLVGIADGALAYGSFRSGTFTIVQAFLASVAIVATISVSHFLYASWIKRAKTTLQRFIRISIILVIAFTFFAWVGNLRASAASNIVDISLESSDISTVSSPHINGWAISLISFVLFAVILFLSLLLWKSRTERLREQEFNKLSDEIKILDNEIYDLEKEKTNLQLTALQRKSEARKVFNYVTTSLSKVKNIGRNAIIEYKRTYARFHNDMIPAYFSAPYDPVYDESLKFQQSPKTEPV